MHRTGTKPKIHKQAPKEHKVRAKWACKDNVFQPIRRPAVHPSIRP